MRAAERPDNEGGKHARSRGDFPISFHSRSREAEGRERGTPRDSDDPLQCPEMRFFTPLFSRECAYMCVVALWLIFVSCGFQYYTTRFSLDQVRRDAAAPPRPAPCGTPGRTLTVLMLPRCDDAESAAPRPRPAGTPPPRPFAPGAPAWLWLNTCARPRPRPTGAEGAAVGPVMTVPS